MNHSPEWHLAEGERLLEQADLLCAELDLNQPAARAMMDSLIQCAKLHIRLGTAAQAADQS